MCGIAAIVGVRASGDIMRRMLERIRHRGPDATGVYADPGGEVMLGHNRLSIIDLSDAAGQPMSSADGRLHIVFNGEIYNYRELRAELAGHAFRTSSDTEVLLAAYERWGPACLDRLLGMFAFVVWDGRERRIFAARDRFGVKPLYYHRARGGGLLIASEIKGLWAAGVPADPEATSWAGYLAHGSHEQGSATFWHDVCALPAGHSMEWHEGKLRIHEWYDLANARTADIDARGGDVVREEYLDLLHESVRLRCRADVPVGVNLSGGVDSSVLLAVLAAIRNSSEGLVAFTFVSDDIRYDELPWVERMLAHQPARLVVAALRPEDVPGLAGEIQDAQDEPFGGMPTLAYAKLFGAVRAEGIKVVLDGQGMDEQWAGYDYYRTPDAPIGRLIQGVESSPVRPDCMVPEFLACAPSTVTAAPFRDPLRDMQYRDARFRKLPRALRFADRVSMHSSVELREPFLDHRLFELALRQPRERKLGPRDGKQMLRDIAAGLTPAGLAVAPKRALQTPQREWLRGPLRGWADAQIERALQAVGGGWLDAGRVRSAWGDFCRDGGDNTFYIWQWINIGLALGASRSGAPGSPARLAPADAIAVGHDTP